MLGWEGRGRSVHLPLGLLLVLPLGAGGGFFFSGLLGRGKVEVGGLCWVELLC